MSQQYSLPVWLEGVRSDETYRRWLYAKAAAHSNRDKKRGNPTCTAEAYRTAIHEAVVASNGQDSYTGRPLRWDLISTYDNELSRTGKRAYKASLADMPSLDHVGDGLGAADFKICSWRINDAKNDQSYEEFVELCRWVIQHADKREPNS